MLNFTDQPVIKTEEVDIDEVLLPNDDDEENVEYPKEHDGPHCDCGLQECLFSKLSKRQKLKKDILKCDVCNYQCWSQIDMEQHESTHIINSFSFQCIYCNFNITTTKDLLEHGEQHKNGIRKCKICEYSTNSLIHMKWHTEAHDKKRSFYCDDCKFLTVTWEKMKAHYKIIHKKQFLKGMFACKSCSFNCGKKEEMHDHVIKTHTKDKEKLFNCNFCDKLFHKKTDWSKHLQTHSGNKPYKCQKCNYRSSRLATLKIHMLEHDGKKSRRSR